MRFGLQLRVQSRKMLERKKEKEKFYVKNKFDILNFHFLHCFRFYLILEKCILIVVFLLFSLVKIHFNFKIEIKSAVEGSTQSLKMADEISFCRL